MTLTAPLTLKIDRHEVKQSHRLTEFSPAYPNDTGGQNWFCKDEYSDTHVQMISLYDKMVTRNEQLVVIKFLMTESEKASRVLDRLQAVNGEHCLSKSQVYKWYQRFRNRRTNVWWRASGTTCLYVGWWNCFTCGADGFEDRGVTVENLSSATGISVEEVLCSLGAQTSPARSKEPSILSVSRTSTMSNVNPLYTLYLHSSRPNHFRDSQL